MLDPSELDNVLQKAKIDCYSLEAKAPSEKFCRLIFDGIMCWQQTPSGALAKQSCSNKYIKSIKTGFATKLCDENGEWFIPENKTESWTNYTQCGGLYIERQINATFHNHTIYNTWIPIIKNITQCGYVLSTITLVIALIIFVHIKRLHCARNKLHIHLFASFVMRALMSLLKDALFVKGTALPHEIIYENGEPVFKPNYSWICKVIISVWNYFIVSNYTFLLMEGAYLHNLLFLKLFSETRVSIYYSVGWGFPIIFVGPWAILKSKYDDVYCWTMRSSKYISWLIDIPIGSTVIINFILFTIIVRVLFIKLTSVYAQRWTKYQKLIRAILILVPLFGIPYVISFILSFYVTQNQTLEILWLFFDQTFTAFQGLFASLVYCLLNNEVQVEVARKYRIFKDRNNKEFKRRSRTISHTTQIPLTEEMHDVPQNLEVKELFKTSDYF